MDVHLSSFSLFDLKAARQRLYDAYESGILSSSEALLAIHILSVMIEVAESGTYDEVAVALERSSTPIRLDPHS